MPAFNLFNWSEFQFVSNQAVMAKDLDQDGGSTIEVTLYAEEPVRMWLVRDDDAVLVAEAKEIKGAFQTLGFNRLEIRSKKSTSYAVSAFITSNVQSEHNDGEMAVLEPALEADLLLERKVQHRIIQELAAGGMDLEDIEDIMTGLNSDEDLTFDDDLDLPSEAEMNELIESARIAAAEQPDPSPADDEDSQPDPDPDPSDDD